MLGFGNVIEPVFAIKFEEENMKYSKSAFYIEMERLTINNRITRLTRAGTEPAETPNRASRETEI